MPYTKKMYITEIDKEFRGDTKFPEFDIAAWEEVERIKKAQENIKYDFVTYQRR